MNPNRDWDADFSQDAIRTGMHEDVSNPDEHSPTDGAGASEVLAVAATLEAHDLPVTVIGPAGGGTGLAYVVEFSGRKRILKWQRPGDGTPLEEVAQYLRNLRRAGSVVPDYEFLLRNTNLEASVQEILPGETRNELSGDVVRHAEELVETHRGAGASWPTPWGDRLLATTIEGAETWCRHDSLLSYSRGTRALWDQVEVMCRDLDPSSVPEGDLVHMDFHHRNLLQRDRRVTGIIDWEGIEPGDRAFDLFTLAFYSGVAGWGKERRTEWLRDLTASSVPDAAALYLAHLSVRSVDWAIRNETEADVRRWLGWSAAALQLIS